MKIRQAQLSDLDAITELTYRLNSQKEHRVAYCCSQKIHIRNDYEFMIGNQEHMVLIGEENGVLNAVLGIFCIEEIKRLDCVGPFAEHNFTEAGTKLIQEVINLRPNYQLNFYFDRRNEEYKKLMESLGAVDNGLELCMRIKRKAAEKIERNECVVPLSENEYDQLAYLHDQIFKGLYLTSGELLKSLHEERQVYVIKEKDQICAYGVLKAPEGDRRATAEVFAVDETYRGKGYGRQIVNEVLRQGFSQYDIEEMSLIVDDDNVVAKKLYESVGFVSEEEYCNYEFNKW